MATEPIAKIRLPTHHPAIKDGKNGDMIRLHAKRVDEPDMIEPGGPSKGPKPPPLETNYHVMAINKAKAAAAADTEPDEDDMQMSPKREKGPPMSPIDRLKKKRAGMPTTAAPMAGGY